MKPFVWLALLLAAWFALPVGAQGPTPVGTTSGRVLLTLRDAGGQPVAGARAQFVTEQQATLATCTTDGAGRCTLGLPNAPADASGFVRGALVVEGRGRKPLLWPGGDFPLTATLDAGGQLDVPVDVYVTRTPLPPTRTPRPAATPSPVVTTATEQAAPLTPSPAGAAHAALATPAQPALDQAGSQVPATGTPDFWWIVGLLALFGMGIALYGWWGARRTTP